MRTQLYLALVLASITMWAMAYFMLQWGYQSGQTYGVIPNLHIKQLIGLTE